MNAAKGVVKNGGVILDNPTELPEGCRVVVEPLISEMTFGVREEDWQNTPEAVADWLKWYDALEPLQMTPQEEAEWKAALQARKEREKAHFVEKTDTLRRMWE